jgi:hypothetical protein
MGVSHRFGHFLYHWDHFGCGNHIGCDIGCGNSHRNWCGSGFNYRCGFYHSFDNRCGDGCGHIRIVIRVVSVRRGIRMSVSTIWVGTIGVVRVTIVVRVVATVATIVVIIEGASIGFSLGLSLCGGFTFGQTMFF